MSNVDWTYDKANPNTENLHIMPPGTDLCIDPGLQWVEALKWKSWLSKAQILTWNNWMLSGKPSKWFSTTGTVSCTAHFLKTLIDSCMSDSGLPQTMKLDVTSSTVPQSLSEFLSWHLNQSFPRVLLFFYMYQSQLSFLPIYQLNEHHGGWKISKWLLCSRTSPPHYQLSFNVLL